MRTKSKMFTGVSQRSMIREAIGRWEAETCVRFDEKDVDTEMADPHLVFTASRNDGWAPFPPLQLTVTVSWSVVNRFAVPCNDVVPSQLKVRFNIDKPAKCLSPMKIPQCFPSTRKLNIIIFTSTFINFLIFEIKLHSFLFISTTLINVMFVDAAHGLDVLSKNNKLTWLPFALWTQ